MATSTCLTVVLALTQICLALAYLPADYESRSASSKRDILWTQIGWEVYPADKLPTANLGAFQAAQALVPTFLTQAFNRVSDEMIEGRPKIFHTYGTCAKAKFVPASNTNFTGIFKSGFIGIIRPSLAKYVVDNHMPGMGFKALIDGKPSVNFHTLYSLDGQGENLNFFANNVSNVINGSHSLALQMAIKGFELALLLLPGGSRDRPENSNTMSLYEHSAINQDGSVVPEGTRRAPWRVDFVGPNAVQQNPTENVDFRIKIGLLQPNTTIYDVIGYRTKEQAQTQVGGEHMGSVVTESEFVASKYCDETLYMKHATKPWKQN